MMELEHILRNFLDDNKRLISFPAKRKMKLYALLYLAQKIEPQTVSGLTERIKQLNEYVENGREPSCEEMEHFACCLNSYFGFLKHHRSYAIRRSIGNLIAKGWWKYVYVSGHFEKVSVMKRHRVSHAVRRKALDIRNGVYYKR